MESLTVSIVSVGVGRGGRWVCVGGDVVVSDGWRLGACVES